MKSLFFLFQGNVSWLYCFDTSEAVDKQLRLLRAMDTNYCIELHIASACGVDRMAFLDEFHGHVAQLGINPASP